MSLFCVAPAAGSPGSSLRPYHPRSSATVPRSPQCENTKIPHPYTTPEWIILMLADILWRVALLLDLTPDLLQCCKLFNVLL